MAQVQAVLLQNSDVPAAIDFYAKHAIYGLFYPRDQQWVEAHFGTDFFLFGIRVNGDFIALMWTMEKEALVYFSIENGGLILKNAGAHIYNGGWCIRPDYQQKGVLQLLAATLFDSWFNRIHTRNAPPLWGKMMGRKDDNNAPLFWNRVGKKITGLSYDDLLALPLGHLEHAILERWPKDPMPLSDIPQDILQATMGKTSGPLEKSGNRLSQWGYADIIDCYVPTSLNYYKRATEASVRASIIDPEKFLEETLADTIKRLNTS